MKHSREFVSCGLALVLGAMSGAGPALAGPAGDEVSRVESDVFEPKTPADPDNIITGGRGVTGKSAVAGLCSLVIPGIGQAINANPVKKVVVHGGIGLLGFIAFVHPVGIVFGLFHVWSAWDALIDRPGGYINGTVQAPLADGWLDASSNDRASSGETTG